MYKNNKFYTYINEFYLSTISTVPTNIYNPTSSNDNLLESVGITYFLSPHHHMIRPPRHQMIRRVSSNDKTKDSSIKDSSIKDSFFSIKTFKKILISWYRSYIMCI